LAGRTSTSRWMSCNGARVIYITHLIFIGLYAAQCHIKFIYRRGMCAAMTPKSRWLGDVTKTIKTVFTMRPDCDHYILYAPDVGQVCDCSRRHSHLSNLIQFIYVYIYRQRPLSERSRKYCLSLLQWRNIRAEGLYGGRWFLYYYTSNVHRLTCANIYIVIILQNILKI